MMAARGFPLVSACGRVSAVSGALRSFSSESGTDLADFRSFGFRVYVYIYMYTDNMYVYTCVCIYIYATDINTHVNIDE